MSNKRNAPEAMREPWDTALHESGHAIVAISLDLPFEEVGIVIAPDGSSKGAIRYGPVDERRLTGNRCDPAFVQRVDAYLRLYLAGKIAEDLAAEQQARTIPTSWLVGMEDDRQNIQQMLHALHPRDAAARQRRCDVAIAWCRAHLRAAWPTVETVARALLQQRRLSAAQVRAIVHHTRDG